MGKKKSVVLLIIYTLLIAVLCFICTVSFSYGTDNMYTFSSVMRMMDKDADLGLAYGANADAGAYLGGGYSAVYYPEGVISAKEYDDNIRDMSEEDAAEYADTYVRYPDANGSVYLEKGVAANDDGTMQDSFKSAFDSALKTVTERVARLRVDGARVDVVGDYAIRVFMPSMMDGEYSAMTLFAYTGALDIRCGTDEASATSLFNITSKYSLSDYIKSIGSRTSGDTAYVEFIFTDMGQEALKTATSGAAETAVTLYFYVGDTSVISLSVSEVYDQNSLYISGSYTAETANAVAVLFDTAMSGSADDLTFTAGDAYFQPALYGGNTVYMLYIAFGVCFVAMMAFFFIRYRRLGFVHLYTYLLFLFAMILCGWSIPFVYLSVETFLAFMLASVLLCVSNAVTFESARKEYALGKTMTSSVKTGYKKCFWKLFDLHIAVALIAFLVAAIAISSLQVAAFVLGLATVFSGVGTLAVNRFGWAVMMATSKQTGKFCNFKREEVEDE